MKNFSKKYITLFVFLSLLFFAVAADAEEPRKGFIFRLWDRAKAVFSRSAPEVDKKEPEKQQVKGEGAIKEEPKADKEKPPVRKKERTKKEKIEIIKRRLGVFPEIMDFIPGLGMREDIDGNPEYFYVPSSGIAKEISQLDEEIISKLYVRVNQEATKIHTERILKQIQQQQQQERLLRNIQRVPRQPVQPPTPPPAPPQAPGTKVPEGPPKVPQTPPSIPNYNKR